MVRFGRTLTKWRAAPLSATDKFSKITQEILMERKLVTTITATVCQLRVARTLATAGSYMYRVIVARAAASCPTAASI